ncbi:MAG: hypothetical protein M3R59_06250 [Verrucomicrobiota bacterium]|nr:hypothetical protein [Verrucomicrobiota bacterium]
MNGMPAKVEIIAPFDRAIQLTKRILFQPFSFEKWIVIGFAAFLSHFAGSGSPNFSFRNFRNRDFSFHWTRHLWHTPEAANHLVWLVAFGIGLAIVLAVVIALLWVGARGRFIFLDCIVRNRGAIVQPWHEYRREGNSFFLFLLATAFCFLLVLGLLALPIILSWNSFSRGALFMAALIFGGLFFVLMTMAWNVVSQVVLVSMFTRRCRALEAFGHATSLITADPIPFILYALFLFALAIATVMLGCLAACVTCCVAAIPYVGTVILLPLYVCLAAYPLLFLRQFGTRWDAWQNIAAEPTPAALAPPLPPVAPPIPEAPPPREPEPPTERSSYEPPPDS